jgi:nucleoid-associated protein YgaU
MKLFIAIAAAAVLSLLAACNSAEKKELAEVPPPPPVDQQVTNNVQWDDTQLAAGYQSLEEMTSPQPVVEPSRSGPLSVNYSGTHVIQKGDTLWSIARQYLGDGKRWKEILQANPGIQPDKLRVGSTITLP